MQSGATTTDPGTSSMCSLGRFLPSKDFDSGQNVWSVASLGRHAIVATDMGLANIRVKQLSNMLEGGVDFEAKSGLPPRHGQAAA